MQFPYIRQHFPAIFPSLLPFFVVNMFFLEVLAFAFLYVALVYLDMSSEYHVHSQPYLQAYPNVSGTGNLIPGYAIIAGILIIGYPWAVAGLLWLSRQWKRLIGSLCLK
jgi:hypothetical protein